MRPMAVVSIVVAIVIGGTRTARAQSYDDGPSKTNRVVKVLIGAGALVAGTAVAATSSKTTQVTGALGTTETSEFSTSQLITGLAVAGTGGFLVWDGLRDHNPRRPFTTVGVGVGKKSTRVLIRRIW